jgi:hypothetical protein
MAELRKPNSGTPASPISKRLGRWKPRPMSFWRRRINRHWRRRRERRDAKAATLLVATA